MKANGLELIQFNIEDIEKEQDFTIKELVNDITFINQSQNVDIYVNNTKLIPGQAFNAGGNYREYNLQLYTVRFVYQGAGTQVNKCVVLLKKYTQIH
jgi:hypothetical protein